MIDATSRPSPTNRPASSSEAVDFPTPTLPVNPTANGPSGAASSSSTSSSSSTRRWPFRGGRGSRGDGTSGIGGTLPPSVVEVVRREQAHAAAIVHRLRVKHPDWSPRTLGVVAMSEVGVKRTSRAALSGGIAGIPAVGTVASVVTNGADEARALSQLIRLILAAGYSMTGEWVDLPTSCRWVSDVLADVGHPASVGAKGGALSPAVRKRIDDRVGALTTRVASRTATATASKAALRKLGKYAPLGASALVAVALSGTEIARVAVAAFRYFDTDTAGESTSGPTVVPG